MLVNADHAALEDTKHAFDGIGRHIDLHAFLAHPNKAAASAR
jgi:hypothetical protein